MEKTNKLVNSVKHELFKKKNDDINYKKIKILITIVNRSKATFYLDLLEQYEVNFQTIIYGKGTANEDMINYLGLAEIDKAVIFSIIREDKEKDIKYTLDNKFKTVRNGKGIAYIIPISSVVGVYIYQYLTNNRKYLEEKANG